MPVLYFVRHGETDWNLEARLQGQRDIPLNDLGRVQSEEVGRKLRDLEARPEDLAFVASPLTRTRDTMERLRGAIGLHPPSYSLDERLKELSFGRWEGLTWKEVRKQNPAGARARERDKWGFVPPGGESYAMAADRIRPFLAGLERDSVVVSHGGIARCALALICGVPVAEAPLVDIWQGRILVIAGKTWRWA